MFKGAQAYHKAPSAGIYSLLSKVLVNLMKHLLPLKIIRVLISTVALKTVGIGVFMSLNCMAQDFAELPPLLPFTSDGCSLFPDGSPDNQQLWLPCCVAHDKAYWQGGSFNDRIAADDALLQCVKNLGEPVVAATMLLGVRVGGSPFWPTQFRWGYGWRQWRGYAPLTAAEIVLINAALAPE